MRILVTGASGFVGRRLCAALARRGHRVAGTYLDEAPDLPEIDLWEVDLSRDGDRFAQVVARSRPDRVVHLAALSHVGSSWEGMAEYFRVNVLGTERVLDAVGVPVILASSAEVYGSVPESEQPISEDRPVAPASPYALTKAAAERLVAAAGGIVVRPFNLVGPGQDSRFALPAFADQLAAIARGEQDPVLKVGNLSARRDFLHVDDGVEGFADVVERARSGEVYQVASGEARSVAEALDRLVAASGLDVEVEVDPSRLRPVDVPLLVGDPRRLRALGWWPRSSLDGAVADLLAERGLAPSDG